MDALFIGHSYTDITFVTDRVPTGDERHEGQEYAFCVGGNAVSAAFAAAKLGLNPDLITQVGNDRLGDVFLQRAAKKHIRIFQRPVKRSSLSIILPQADKRAIMSTRDTDYLDEHFPRVSMDGYKILHVDGHMMDAAVHHARAARDAGVLTSLDGGAWREGMDGLLPYIDVAAVSEDFAQQLNKSPEETLAYLHNCGVKVAAITLGAKGVYFSEGVGDAIQHVPAFHVPLEKIKDTTGAGDIFHGAYVYSYVTYPHKTWFQHFTFASAASSLCVQKLGSETGAPTLAEVEAVLKGHML